MSKMLISAHSILLYFATTAALPSNAWAAQCIDPNDFVRVEGLRLYDSKGLHYVTGMFFFFNTNHMLMF